MPHKSDATPDRTRRTLLHGLAGLGAAATLPRVLGPASARAADYPPTTGAMQGFILFETPRRPETPDFQDGAGRARAFGDFRGRVLLVNFWATWCAPCLKEMPDLANLQRALGGPDFTVLAISQDRGGASVAAPFLRDRLGLPDLPAFYDPKSAVGRAMGVRGLPTTFLLDRQGRALGYLAGAAKWDGPDAKALVRHVIGEGATRARDQA